MQLNLHTCHVEVVNASRLALHQAQGEREPPPHAPPPPATRSAACRPLSVALCLLLLGFPAAVGLGIWCPVWCLPSALPTPAPAHAPACAVPLPQSPPTCTAWMGTTQRTAPGARAVPPPGRRDTALGTGSSLPAARMPAALLPLRTWAHSSRGRPPRAGRSCRRTARPPARGCTSPGTRRARGGGGASARCPEGPGPLRTLPCQAAVHAPLPGRRLRRSWHRLGRPTIVPGSSA